MTAVFYFMLAACAPANPITAPAPVTADVISTATPKPVIANAIPTSTPMPTPDLYATPTNIWFAIQERTPYPYATPLPPPTATALDGTYAKDEPILGTPVHCLRCPDYASDGGEWLLRFDKGIFRIHSKLTGWRSIGSYTVSDNLLTLYNDGYCGTDVGTYTWRIEERKLILEEIKDVCSFHLRAKNLTLLPWASCQPPNIEAAISDHWQIPRGCR